nr:HigA family addiction module antitoxin [uncultured Arsenicibacter sp.]
MANLKPQHPGKVLRDKYLSNSQLNISTLAKGLGVARVNLSAIVNERAGVSPELAVKLSEALGTKAEYWLGLQKDYELWLAEKKVDRSLIKKINDQTN